MFKAVVSKWVRRAAFFSLLLIGFSTFAQSGTGSVTLNWYPSPSTNVAGYKVYYGLASRTYFTNIDVGNVTNATVTGLTRGTTYYFAVTAYDAAGLESDYSDEVVYTVPTLPPPAVALTAPANGASYLAPASIGLTASVTTNSHTINQVQFYNGATLLGTVTTAPYTFAWNNVAAGTYTLSAQVGYDSSSNATSASIIVTVTNLVPVVALTAPINGTYYTAPASIGLAASVTANGNSITSVRFYNGATLLGTSATAPYTFAWNNVGAGSYGLSAQVVYGSGSTAASGTATVTVTNPAPAIALTAPANGANYTAPAAINLAAGVTANGHAINQVQFYNGATLLGTATTAPYTFAWNNVAAGAYSLSAQLDYDSGSVMASAAVSVTVTNLAPVVTLTAPVSGTSYTAPASIGLAASVTANGNSITSVRFYNGATLLGTSATAPYTFAWNNVGAGSYGLSAQVVYGSGSTVVSGTATVTVTNPPIGIVLTAPANGASYLAPASISLAASVTTNSHTINQVQFYSGATLLGTVTTAPYTFAWNNVVAGTYTLSAQVGYDSGGTASSALISVTVTNPAPIVTLTAPVNGAYYTAPASIGLAASVTANGNSITGVQFYNGGTLLGTSATPPYTFAWNNVSAGSYGLSAQVVYGSVGAQASGTVNVTVTNPPPTIALTTPTNGANYAAPAVINLAANVTANGHAITQVSFYNGATQIGSAAAAPYTFAWNNVSAGTYSLSAQLVYDSSSTLATATASVTVHTPPTISAITNYLMVSNSVSKPIPFAVADVETDASNLTLSASSDNPVLIPAANVVFGGSGANRTATITPSLNHTGYANLTITVSYGVASASTTFQVTVEGAGSRPAPPTLIDVIGSGTITPDLNGQALVIGQSYTVTAVPGPGQRFAGWTGSLGSLNPTVTFIMSSSFSLTASFVPSPYAVTSGTFSGLFYETNQDQVQPYSAGTFTVVVTTRGSYSGHLQIGSTRYPFSGYLGTNGQASKSILRRASTALNLQLNLGAGTAADQVSGTLSDGKWVATLAGDRAVFDTRTSLAPYAGHYTLILPGQDTNSSVPSGDGYGAVRVTSGGLVMFAGKLADGTTISQSATVSKEGTWPLYVSLYTGNGLMAGWLDFTNEVNDDLSGQVTWIKPATANTHYYPGGFTSEFTAAGSIYVQPASRANEILSLTNGMITFAGGNLSAPITNSIALGVSSHVTDLSANKLSLGFSLSTGLFTGRVTDPTTGNSLPFGGAVFQKLDAGYGFLLGSDQSSDVLIGQ